MIVRCSNPECGHVWVMVSEYSHTLKQSQLPPREDVHQCGNWRYTDYSPSMRFILWRRGGQKPPAVLVDNCEGLCPHLT